MQRPRAGIGTHEAVPIVIARHCMRPRASLHIYTHGWLDGVTLVHLLCDGGSRPRPSNTLFIFCVHKWHLSLFGVTLRKYVFHSSTAYVSLVAKLMGNNAFAQRTLRYDPQISQSQSQYVLVSIPLCGRLTRYCFLFKCLGLEFVVLSLCGALSDERPGLSFVSLAIRYLNASGEI
jgi:hypothetical protein